MSARLLSMHRRSASKARRPCINNRLNRTNGWPWSNSSVPATNIMPGNCAMPNITRLLCATVWPLLMCGCQSFLTPPKPPMAAQCQVPPPPAAWFMQPHEPDLTRRMLSELSASPMPATKD